MERARAALTFERAGLFHHDAPPEARVVHGLSQAFLGLPLLTFPWNGMNE
jgi:hypothetical protein